MMMKTMAAFQYFLFIGIMGCGTGSAFNPLDVFDGDESEPVIFPCESCRWHHPTINDGLTVLSSFSAYDQQQAISSNGDAIVAWKQGNGSATHIYISHRKNGVWVHPLADDPLTFHTDNADTVGVPKIAMDSLGNAIIMWGHYENISGIERIFKAEYQNGVWIKPTSVSDAISPAGTSVSQNHYSVSMNASGDAVLAWYQITGSEAHIFKSERRGSAWVHPNSLSDKVSASGATATDPEVAINDSGYTLITWKQSGRIYKSEYLDGTWYHPALSTFISMSGTSVSSNPRLAINNSNHAIISWSQSTGASNYRIFKAENRLGYWEYPNTLNDGFSASVAFPSDGIKICMNSSGNTAMTWHQATAGASPYYRVLFSHFFENVWSHPASTDAALSPAGLAAAVPAIGCDDYNNVFLAWRQEPAASALYQIYIAEYRNAQWMIPTAAQFISPLDVSGAPTTTYAPSLVTSKNGQAILTWVQADGANTKVYVSEFK